MRKKIFSSPLFIGLLGPTLLSSCFGLVLLKFSNHHVWSLGIGLSFFLALFVLIFTLMDLHFEFSHLKKKHEEDQHQIAHLKDSIHKIQVIDQATIQREMHGLEKKALDQIESVKMQKEEEIQNLRKAYEALFQETTSHKQKSTSLQISLDEALEQLRKTRKLEFIENELKQKLDEFQKNSVVPESNENSDPSQNALQQVRKQFEEKSALLDETRKELFQVESNRLALEKEKEINATNIHEQQWDYIQHFKEIEQENKDLEDQVILLEQLLMVEMTPQKRASKVKKEIKNAEEESSIESLELEF